VISERELTCTAVIFFVSPHAVGLHQRAFDVLVLGTVFSIDLGALCESVQRLIIFYYIPVCERVPIQNTPVAIGW